MLDQANRKHIVVTDKREVERVCAVDEGSNTTIRATALDVVRAKPVVLIVLLGCRVRPR